MFEAQEGEYMVEKQIPWLCKMKKIVYCEMSFPENNLAMQALSLLMHYFLEKRPFPVFVSFITLVFKTCQASLCQFLENHLI